MFWLLKCQSSNCINMFCRSDPTEVCSCCVLPTQLALHSHTIFLYIHSVMMLKFNYCFLSLSECTFFAANNTIQGTPGGEYLFIWWFFFSVLNLLKHNYLTRYNQEKPLILFQLVVVNHLFKCFSFTLFYTVTIIVPWWLDQKRLFIIHERKSVLEHEKNWSSCDLDIKSSQIVIWITIFFDQLFSPHCSLTDSHDSRTASS